MGWEVHEDEQSAHASVLIRKTCLAEGIREAGLVLHSDNGGPMKGATMLAARKWLFEAAKQARPERLSGDTRNWTPINEVWLSPPQRKESEGIERKKESRVKKRATSLTNTEVLLSQR